MPPLDNPHHEAFAQAVAAGKSRKAAYESCGLSANPKTASVRASQLGARDDIRDRIDELRGQVPAPRPPKTSKPRKRKRPLPKLSPLARIAGGEKREGVSLHRPEYNEQVYRLALLGLTDRELAAFFGIAEPTFYEWQRRHPDFAQAHARGKLLADGEIAEKLHHRARGYSHEAVKIFMPAGATEPVYAPYTQHYPPDTGAASLWLRNRQPRLWRDKQEVEHVLSYEQRLKEMTPEERDADAEQLWAEIQQVLEDERRERAAAEATDAEYEDVDKDGGIGDEAAPPE